MPWTPQVWDGGGYDAATRDYQIGAYWEQLQNWASPTVEPALSRFPWYATLMQTLVFRAAVVRGLIPMTAAGVQTFLATNGVSGQAIPLMQEMVASPLYQLYDAMPKPLPDEDALRDAILRAWLVQDMQAGRKDAYFTAMAPAYSYKPAGYLKAFEIANWASDANMLAARAGLPLPFRPGTSTLADQRFSIAGSGGTPLVSGVGGGSFGTSPTFDPPTVEVPPPYTQPIILYAPDPTNPLTAVPGTNPLTPGAPVLVAHSIQNGHVIGDESPLAPPTPLVPGVGHNPLTPSMGPNAQSPGVTGGPSGGAGAPGASGGISLPLVVGVGVLAFLASRKGRGTRTWGG